jgi:hypothetical protein
MRLRRQKKVQSEIEENMECRAKEESDELAGH